MTYSAPVLSQPVEVIRHENGLSGPRVARRCPIHASAFNVWHWHC